jgi:hypothetical protein
MAFFDYCIATVTAGEPARGCLSTRTAVEAARESPEAAAAVRGLLARLEDLVHDKLSTLDDDTAAIDLRAAARLVVTTTRGLAVMERARHEPADHGNRRVPGLIHVTQQAVDGGDLGAHLTHPPVEGGELVGEVAGGGLAGAAAGEQGDPDGHAAEYGDHARHRRCRLCHRSPPQSSSPARPFHSTAEWVTFPTGRPLSATARRTVGLRRHARLYSRVFSSRYRAVLRDFSGVLRHRRHEPSLWINPELPRVICAGHRRVRRNIMFDWWLRGDNEVAG